MQKNSPQQNQYHNQQQQQQQQWMMRRPANYYAAAATTTSVVDSTQSTFNEVDETVQAPQSADSRYFSFPSILCLFGLIYDI